MFNYSLVDIMCPLVDWGVDSSPPQRHHSNAAATNVAIKTIAESWKNTHTPRNHYSSSVACESMGGRLKSGQKHEEATKRRIL